MKKRDIRGQAQVITVVLLILITIVLTVIIIGFVVPFVNDKLSSGDCFDVVGDDKIGISSGYTCYDSITKDMRVQISIGKVREFIEGFSIEIGGASTNNYKITNGTIVIDVSMYSDPNPEVELPEDNTKRTYIIKNVNIKPNVINVYPILKNNKICSASDTATIIDVCLWIKIIWLNKFMIYIGGLKNKLIK